MTVSQPVDRRLTFFPEWLVQDVTLASPPFPILRIVRRQECCFSFGVGDAGLLFAERELERFFQELLDFLLDLLCKLLTSAKSDDPIVGISQVFESDKVWIVRYH